jgi:hypothetical protein
MTPRLRKELDVLRSQYPEMVYVEEGFWIKVPSYPLPDGWSRKATDAAFQVPPAYPGSPPYGIFVPAGIRYSDAKPENYQEPAANRPPFEGDWGFFSWSIDGQWTVPTADFFGGCNLLSFVRSFADRFVQGR